LTTTGPSLSLNQWHHIAVTWRSGEQVIYIDGVERARSSRTGSLDINNDPLQVGQDLNIASRFFDGDIDEVRIYENFLSTAEVNQVMNETHPCSNATTCASTFEDSFSAASYNNSTGSEPWNGDWIETDDDNSATSGNVLITGGELSMDDRPNSGGEPSLERELDLSTYLSAFINVDLATAGNLESSDRFDISASSDGSVSYTILESFSDSFSGNFNYDLTPFMSNNTRIRFRIENAYGGGGERIDIDNVVITGFKNCGPDHFRILHDGAGINCLREAITIQAENADGTVMTGYTGTIDINLSTNNGNWFVVDNTGFSSDPALGTLSDTAGDNDGFATYEFVASDFGSVALYLENTVAETTNINLSENGVTDDNSEGDITFRPFGFVFSPSPIAAQVAGRPFDITLTAAGQTPAQAECSVIEEYTGNKSIDFWSTYSNPVSSSTFVAVNGSNIAISEATSSSQNIVFTAGITTISTQYDDVGQIGISAKHEIDVGDPPSGNLDEIIGGINPFVVRPFGFDIQVAGDPFADNANDIIFASAGANFDMTLRSVLWQQVDDIDNGGVGDGIPDIGSDLSDNGITPNISQIVGTVNLTPTAMVITNSNGLLSASNVAFASFIADGLANEATYTFSQSWDEVVILQIDALNTSFMSSGEDVTGQRTNIARFIPDHFLLSDPVILEQCGSFSYAGFFDGVNSGLDKSGQNFDVTGTITAQNLANGTTQNYAGSFAKLLASDITLQGFDATVGANATGRVNFASSALNFINGVSVYSDVNVDYQYNTVVASFNLRLDLSATDSDSVISGIVNSNEFEVRLGRMRLIDSYGPEMDNLEMRLFTDYFDGTNWSINAQDSCSTYIDSDVSFDLASYTDQLNDGETSIFTPILSQLLVNGISGASNGLWFSAPGNNNFGSVLVEMDLSSQSWLQFDWDIDIIVDNANARLNFGYYRGSDRVIYWKEIRN
jgi:MSHA biogenesis protein MshQ